MASRAFWTGYLKLSLVTCAVALTPATSERDKIRFHLLNRRTGHRVVSRYVDAVSGKPVEEEDEVKGYERGPDEYVLLEEDELDVVALESERTIDIDMFVPVDAVEWVFYDTPYYMTPNDKVGEEAFAVIREAMAATGTAGIARLVLYRRERAVLLMPRGPGLVLWTLRYGEEVRDAAPLFAGIESERLEPEQIDLIVKLIEHRTTKWTPKMVEDPVQAQLHDLIAAKRRGRRPAKPKKTAEPPSNVVNIMDALRKSVEAERKTPRKR